MSRRWLGVRARHAYLTIIKLAAIVVVWPRFKTILRSSGEAHTDKLLGAPNPQGVTKLEQIWSGLRRADVFPITLATAFGLLRHPDNIVDSGRLRRCQIAFNSANLALGAIKLPLTRKGKREQSRRMLVL